MSSLNNEEHRLCDIDSLFKNRDYLLVKLEKKLNKAQILQLCEDDYVYLGDLHNVIRYFKPRGSLFRGKKS